MVSISSSSGSGGSGSSSIGEVVVPSPPSSSVASSQLKSDTQFEYLKTSKPNGFVLGVVGKPGAGKTTLIQNVIKQTMTREFNYVILCSPSEAEYDGLVPPEQRANLFDKQWLIKTINLLNVSMNSVGTATTTAATIAKVLFILDDCISEIKALEKDPVIINLFFNRRHLLWNGTISIIITTQKYTMVPAKFRSCFTDLVFFNLSPFDIDKIFEDSIVKYTKAEWKTIVARVYDRPFNYVCLNIDTQAISY